MRCDSAANPLSVEQCPEPTHRHDRRFYCAAHAPEGSVPLDRFVRESQMTASDKAVVYDELAEHLRREGWTVVREPHGPSGVRQSWTHPDLGPNAFHDLFSALRLEAFKDAPRQGERVRRMLAGLDEAIERKRVPQAESSSDARVRALVGMDEEDVERGVNLLSKDRQDRLRDLLAPKKDKTGWCWQCVRGKCVLCEGVGPDGRSPCPCPGLMCSDVKRNRLFNFVV